VSGATGNAWQATTMFGQSPFHEGEQRVQDRLGVRESIEPWAQQIVRPYLPDEHRLFHTSLPFLVAAARDADGRPWATLLTGAPGFVRSPDAERLVIDARPVPGDALEGALEAGADLGLLGIDLETRRRNRVNGRIGDDGSSALVFEVDQSFGNCPQYIHERAWQRVPEPISRKSARRARRLSHAMRAWIGNADTFFIASGHRGDGDSAAFGMDASHRGGDAGFVRVESDTRLVFPDYAGNNHFNTIGNLMVDPRAGLLFVDFERGSLLQLTGRTRIDWDSEAVSRFPGARRLVAFELEEAVEIEAALPLRWSTAREFVRTLRLVDRIRESEDVTSFVFESRDGGTLADFEAGQHLPIELHVPGHREPVRRTYSLSHGPGRDRYRISVKREPFGVASRHLHDAIAPGAFVDAHRPAGEFVLAKPDRPVALISAGIGVTPMVSMLNALVDGPMPRPVWFIHGARDGAHHPLSDEVRALAAKREHAHVHVAYSRPRADDVPGVDYDSTGRVDADLVATLVPDLDAEFYLCGPTAFLADVHMCLMARGVAAERIHTEAFGPAG
jgi:ferredoxin-NADP reductase/predicted pyridoxine 5'-phosphate oxidase superfamily flavin-nucleotide-binding protein